LGNDDYPFTNFKGSGNWKYIAPKADGGPPKDDGGPKEEPEKPVPCKLRDGFKPWPMCP
jgi:hypothetical protein